ncbi:Putative RlpA family protein [Bradyrhizobium sp. ORS 278]|uniref:septal ring lytic transglycosylase RlpA family protein n=1 Tax=Bradyrhizobium sp. (strain ORS 278) TaxID=114615 RepID=UPI000150822B|nr:septal ring lytic transglycosylase RlpA family protein [Bradyrhizobium sp. ORS 278]CAL77151.1 Putative RlpA family protein [Bradyrhizobium sp. ORS 278]
MASNRRERAPADDNETVLVSSRLRRWRTASAARVGWMIAALAAASLAACARSPLTAQPVAAPGHQAALTPAAPPQTSSQESPPALTTAPAAPAPKPRRPHYLPRGIASYYTAPQPTANGEVFDAFAMTAAHRSLPFGTRLRVTRLDTGQSVTVRINDRGPYIDGRIVDLSYAAAAKLGMVETGLANVRLDVLRWPKPKVRNPPPQQVAPGNARPLPRAAPTRLTLLWVREGGMPISR